MQIPEWLYPPDTPVGEVPRLLPDYVCRHRCLGMSPIGQSPLPIKLEEWNEERFRIPSSVGTDPTALSKSFLILKRCFNFPHT
jgi:hypothetical protein